MRVTADVPPSLEWLAEGLLTALIRGQLSEETLDESSVERYQQRVPIP